MHLVPCWTRSLHGPRCIPTVNICNRSSVNVNIPADSWNEAETSGTRQRWMTFPAGSNWSFLPTNMLFRFVKHRGFVKLCGIVPTVLLVSLICSYGNKNKSKITREEQVDDEWRRFLSLRPDTGAVLVTMATVLTTFLHSTAQFCQGWAKPMFSFPQFRINWAIELL